MKSTKQSGLSSAIGAVMLGSLATLSTAAAAQGFGHQNLESGYMQIAAEASCGGKESKEAKCGEGKCGEGKCGADKAKKEGKCGEGKCGADKAKKEGKCGEGKCGADKAKKEGKCGEGKCGGAK